MFKRCFFLQRLWSFQNPEFQHWNAIDFKEVRVECMRISKNVWEKLVALNTPRLLGPPGLPVILSQSSPILLAFNAPLISGCLGFLKVMSYDYFHGLMLMMFVISCCLFICMYILILCSSNFHRIVYLKKCYPGYPGQSGIASHKYGSCVVAWYLWCQTKRRSNKKWSMKTMAWEMNHPKPNSPRKKLTVACGEIVVCGVCSKVAGSEG